MATPPAEVEDLFPPATYLTLLNTAFRKELGGTEVAEIDLPPCDRIVERLNGWPKAQKLEIRPSGGFSHYDVAHHLAWAPKTKIDAGTLNRFE